MEGKTVDKMEFGFRQDIEGVHGSEALIIHFTDGSIMSIDTGSNVRNILGFENAVRPEQFHVDLHIHWVPGLSRRDKPSH